MISIVIPAYNVEKNIGACLDALIAQSDADTEIIVVDDGSTDATRTIAEAKGVRVLTQKNCGAASARNAGAIAAHGELVLFIDGDCVPKENWLAAMRAPFAAPEIIGAGGMKQTQQRGIIPRFIQMEFDYRYDRERKLHHIDFIDSGTAAYRREVFLQNRGFDTTLADAEDVDLSYRLAARGYKMAFASDAIVYDPHPESLIDYLRRKYAYAFWRTQVYARYPGKMLSDSRTPQTQKIQGVLVGLLGIAILATPIWREAIWLVGLLVGLFGLTTLPFIARFIRYEPLIALMSPLFLALAAIAGALGVALGALKARMR
jgi:glycosyltransferase involved in cell wall biosynthesis